MKAKSRLVALSSILMIVLTGCNSTSELAELQNMEAAPVEADVTENYGLSYADEQGMIYSQVIDRQMLDLTMLTKCSDNELQEVLNYMDAVDAQLVGTASTAIEETIDSCFTNYLLCVFEETPYYWQRTQTIVRGIDAESRSIIVDVDYKTIDFEKTVQKPSSIPLGCVEYEKKLKNRYNKWLRILEAKMSQDNDSMYQQKYDEFVKFYGEFEDIYASQTNLTLTEQMYETGNQKTYEGMIDTEAEQTSGYMTVRYVLVPNYKLGINLGLTCKHMYILDYKLDNDATAGLEIFTDSGYATVTDSVYNLVHSYFQCLDENDYSGLYKLTKDFGNIDKHYEELFGTTYLKHENFTISLFDIQGTQITCGIEVSVKKRAKGSKMTFPLYRDRYYCEMELVDDQLQISNMVLLSSTLEGEPSIKTDDADVLGFANAIDLDNDDKKAIEVLICNFGVLQLKQDTSSDNFGAVVDTSISQSKMKALTKAMLALQGEKKVVWIANYQQGTSNYASVKCTELYQQNDNSIVEASVIYDFILKGSAWYVYGYNIVSSARLGTTNLNTAGCLCLCSTQKVEQYTSQIKGTESNVATDTIVSDVSTVYTHDEYTPKLKNGTVELGLDTEQAYNMSDSDYMDTLNSLASNAGYESSAEDIIMAKDLFLTAYDKFIANVDTTEESEEGDTESTSASYLDLFTVTQYVDDAYKSAVAIYFNKLNNRYSETELTRTVDDFRSSWRSHSDQIQESVKLSEDEDLRAKFTTVNEFINATLSILGR